MISARRAPQAQAVLITDSGPVTLTSWGSFSGAGGVAVSNLGVVSAELKHFARTSDQALSEEFSAYRPDLIVLEFGTNDGFVSHFSAATFEERLREQIRRVRRLAGDVPVLLIGAPDAETKRGRFEEQRGRLCADAAAHEHAARRTAAGSLRGRATGPGESRRSHDRRACTARRSRDGPPPRADGVLVLATCSRAGARHRAARGAGSGRSVLGLGRAAWVGLARPTAGRTQHHR